MEQKERIQAKADELFMRYGIRSVSMDDIAADLAMSKKTLYQFFADKDELVDAVVDKELKRGQCDCIDCRSHSKDAVDEILLTMEQIAEQFRVIKRPLLTNAFNKGPGMIKNGNLIMVTSALAGEGKSFCTVNLAMSIAMEMDRRVLLVDADVVSNYEITGRIPLTVHVIRQRGKE